MDRSELTGDQKLRIQRTHYAGTTDVWKLWLWDQHRRLGDRHIGDPVPSEAELRHPNYHRYIPNPKQAPIYAMTWAFEF